MQRNSRKSHLDDDHAMPCHGGAVADHFTREEGKDEEWKDGEDLHSGSHPPHLGGPVDPPHRLHIHLLLDHQVAKAANAKPEDELGDLVGNGDDEGGLLQAVPLDLLQVLLHHGTSRIIITDPHALGVSLSRARQLLPFQTCAVAWSVASQSMRVQKVCFQGVLIGFSDLGFLNFICALYFLSRGPWEEDEVVESDGAGEGLYSLLWHSANSLFSAGDIQAFSKGSSVMKT